MSSSILRNLLARPTNPSILPIPSRSTGNNVPKSLHKTRRVWRANTTRSDWHVSLPAAFNPELAAGLQYGESSKSGSHSRGNLLKGVKMQMRRRKDVEKAGGLEGLLLSRPSKHLTPFGKHLRSALFDEIHRTRLENLEDKTEMDQSVNDAPPLLNPQHTLIGGGGIATGSGR